MSWFCVDDGSSIYCELRLWGLVLFARRQYCRGFFPRCLAVGVALGRNEFVRVVRI